MAISQNGYQASPARQNIHTVTVPGANVRIPVRVGAAGDLLLWAAARWHRDVEPLVEGWSWGWAYRVIRGGGALSNHASGTAIDLNAPRHPLGTRPSANFTPAQIAAVHRIIADAKGCLRWGGDYSGRADGMHLEVIKPEAECARVLASFNSSYPAPQEDDVQLPELRFLDGTPGTPGGIYHWAVGSVQRLLNDRGLGLSPLTVDGVYGEKTVEAVKVLQRRWKLPETGVVDASTWPWVIWNEAPDFATP